MEMRNSENRQVWAWKRHAPANDRYLLKNFFAYFRKNSECWQQVDFDIFVFPQLENFAILSCSIILDLKEVRLEDLLVVTISKKISILSVAKDLPILIISQTSCDPQSFQR